MYRLPAVTISTYWFSPAGCVGQSQVKEGDWAKRAGAFVKCSLRSNYLLDSPPC